MRVLVLASFLALASVPAAAGDFPDYLTVREGLGNLRDNGGGRLERVDLLVRILDESDVVRFEELHCGVVLVGQDGAVDIDLGTVDPAANPLDLPFDGPWSIAFVRCGQRACDGGLDPSACDGTEILRRPLVTEAYAWRSRHAAESDRARYADDCDRVDGRDASDFMPAGTDEWVNETGDTMTGPLELHADPTEDPQAATKRYVDAQIRNAVPRGYAILGTTLDSPAGFAATGEGVLMSVVSERLPNAPVRGPAVATTLGRRIYVHGNETESHMGVWDADAGTWSTYMMPEPLVDVELVAAAGRVHLLGNTGAAGAPPRHWAYDAAADEWQRLRDPPAGFGTPTLAELDDVLHACDLQATRECARYDVASMTWIPLPRPPRQQWGAALVGVWGKLWAISGEMRGASGGTSFGSRGVQIYDPAAGTWSLGPRLDNGSSAVSATVIDDRLVVHLGDHGSFGWDGTRVRLEVLEEGSGTWEPAPVELLSHRWGFGMAPLDGHIHAIAGTGGWATTGEGATDHEAFTLPRRWYLHVKQ